MFNNYSNMDEVLIEGLKSIECDGHEVSPRDELTKEILCFSFTLTNPLARFICNPARAWSLPLALGEFCWHSSGSNDLESISFYASAWTNSSKDGRTIAESCYGKHIFEKTDGISVWDKVKLLLEKAPQTRRAVINFNKSDLNEYISIPDVACTSSCQFLLRNGFLDIIVNMRSNDVIWGLPYDVFFFTMLQERMAIELGVNLGSYHHIAGSFHLYERHFELSKRILTQEKFPILVMNSMNSLSDLPVFLKREHTLRLKENTTINHEMSKYWQDLFLVLKRYISKKNKGEKLNKTELLEFISMISA